MPQSVKARAAEIQNHAEHTHDKAAVSHNQNDHLSDHELSRETQERSRQTHERAEELVKQAEGK